MDNDKKDEEGKELNSKNPDNEDKNNSDSEDFIKLNSSELSRQRIGRGTVSIPFSKMKSLEPGSTFQSKLAFFNSGKPVKKFQKIPTLKENTKGGDDTNTNINISLPNLPDLSKEMGGSSQDLNLKKNKSNISNDIEIKKTSTFTLPKLRKIQGNVNYYEGYTDKVDPFLNSYSTHKKKKEDNPSKIDNVSDNNINSVPTLINIKGNNFELLTMEEHWKYQKILLDYNILDFTSKSKIYFSV